MCFYVHWTDAIVEEESCCPYNQANLIHTPKKGRIRRERFTNVVYALDTNSPYIIHKHFLSDAWATLSKTDPQGAREFCYNKKSRRVLWEEMSECSLTDIATELCIAPIHNFTVPSQISELDHIVNEGICEGTSSSQEKQVHTVVTYETQVEEFEGHEVVVGGWL